MKFCTAVNCMDGRVQLPVIEFLRRRFDAQYVDMITEPGPNLILAAGGDAGRVQSIFARCDISVEKHGSLGIAVAGHHDCAGNPAGTREQLRHIEEAVKILKRRYPHVEVIGLWLDENFNVHEVKAGGSG